MATRFSDDLANNVKDTDFIIRKRYPLIIQLLVIFSVSFVAIYLSAFIMNDLGSKVFFFITLAIIIGSLNIFTILLILRNRDLVLATEFQNAMLASAAQLSSQFCLITKRDGAIVYIDPAFQKFFPLFMRSDNRTVDSFLLGEDVPEDIIKAVFATLENNVSDRILIPFKDSTGTAMPMMVTIDILPRPKGYFLFRGREYVEKRRLSGESINSANALLLAHAINELSEGMLAADTNGVVAYLNQTLEEWLGYNEGEIIASSLNLKDIIYQYAGNEAGKITQGNFQGEVVLRHKNKTLITLQLQQLLLMDNDKPLGISAVFNHADTLKKKLILAPESGTENLSAFIASSPLAIARLSLDGAVLECNQSLRELVKFTLPNDGWSFLEIVAEESRKEVKLAIVRTLANDLSDKKPLEIELGTDDGTTASLYLSRIEGNASELIAQLINTTEQKNLEQRFAHSQKMQAVGQLAGGIAHDFNNLLTAMIGFCDLLLIRHPAGDQSFADIMQVKQNANRAANLVRQLLAFSRRQTLQPKMLDITDVLAELSNLMRRLIGENIELKMIHGRDLGMVKADQGQLEQVFINLAVNARDAMINGGRLTIRTTHVVIDAEHPVNRDLIPPIEDEAIVNGDYVLVEMTDTGTGIPRDILQKIFEPFFSTKEVGSGTGLGLATVYGIIKQTDGYIYVSSKEGEGTNFSLFFKRYQPEEKKVVAESELIERPSTDDLTGKGTILLVEDETPVRAFAARALRNKGYTVLEADCGETAIEVMDAQGTEVDVIITDVIMPGMNGPTMIETVTPKFPNVKVIFISGYAEDIFVKSYGSEREFNFLPKPFTLKQLASKVKEVIQK
jgi:two-component system cell cycle sensor histidine kinase/response regulator CckA